MRILLIGCSNYSALSSALRKCMPAGEQLEFAESDYGQVMPTLLSAEQTIWQPPPDACFVWTQPHNILPSFRDLLDSKEVHWQIIAAEIEEFCAAIKGAAARSRFTMVATWSLPASFRGLGAGDWTSASGIGPTLARMNLLLAEQLSEAPNVLLLDSARWLQQAGNRATDPKLWMLGKIPFGLPVFADAAADLVAAIDAALGRARKLIVLDLDNTLWGGVVGDDGWENLDLGGTSAAGEAYVEFQRALLALKRRGIILAICSKNEEDVALEAIDKHPEMLLRRDDFAAWRINWNDKATNLQDVVTELNLGLQSVVFIDDEPLERAIVAERCAEVLVPEWSKDPARYATALRSLRCFDVVGLTAEDRQRSGQYLAERQRRSTQSEAGKLEEWLAKLSLQVHASELDAASLARAAQLLNKTNQFNLTTRRMSEAELADWTSADGHHTFVFQVKDRFGDYGLTGLAALSYDGSSAEITDLLMSCRVMGRGVEAAILHYLTTQTLQHDCRELRGRYLPTPKNKPCKDVLKNAGFKADSDCWRYEPDEPVKLPDHITLITEPS